MIREKTDLFGILESAPGEAADQQKQADEEKKVAGFVLEAWEEAKRARSSRQRLMEYCRLMLKGEVLIAQTRASAEVLRVVVAGDPRKPRSLDNLLRVCHRAFVGKLIKIIPSVRVLPRTHDRDDLTAAEVMDSFLDYGWHAQQFKLKYTRAVSCISWSGVGILHPLWNTLGGRKIGLCPQCGYASADSQPGQECPACKMKQQIAQETSAAAGSSPAVPGGGALDPLSATGAAGIPPGGIAPPPTPAAPPTLSEAQEGDLELQVIHPYDFFPDPGAAHPQEMQYCIIAKILPVNVVRKMFPEKAAGIVREDGLYAEKYITATAATGLARGRIETTYLPNHVRLIAYHEMPTGEHPEGRIIYMANGRLLETKPNVAAVELGRLPFFVFRGDVDEGDFWPDPLVLQTEGLQRERDILGTQVRRHRELTISPKWVVATSSGIDAKFIDQTPGEVIKVKPTAMEPKPLRTPMLPSWVPQEADRLKLAVQEKWGVTPYELGQSSSGDSGRFAAFLDTQASSIIAAMLVEIHNEWKELHRAWLILGRRYMPADRVWTITGTDRVLSRSWNTANVKPGWDVYLVEDDSLSKNPQLRMQQADEKLKVGYFTDPQTGQVDWKRYQRMAGLQPESVTPDADAAQHIYASQIPDMIREALAGQGQMPQPQPWDNVWIVAEELKGWLQTKGLSEDPMLVQYVAQMWQQYVMALMPDDPNAMVDPMMAKLLPNQKLAMQQQQPQQAAPGNVTEQGGVATSRSSSEQETAKKIQNVDQSNEQLARAGQAHEGTTV